MSHLEIPDNSAEILQHSKQGGIRIVFQDASHDYRIEFNLGEFDPGAVISHLKDEHQTWIQNDIDHTGNDKGSSLTKLFCKITQEKFEEYDLRPFWSDIYSRNTAAIYEFPKVSSKDQHELMSKIIFDIIDEMNLWDHSDFVWSHNDL